MKKKFLKDLEKRLEILSEDERKDTINEYSNIIDEKVKHSKTEEEAIKEFGNIDELAEEILKAYKINPNYGKNNSSNTNEFVQGMEEGISKVAQKLSDITEDVVDSFKNQNKEFNTNNVFEIIIKVILVLFGLALLKLPFYIVSEIGAGIFEIGPFSEITSFIWKLLVEIIYLAACILLIMSFVNQYTSKSKKKIKNNKEEIIEEKDLEKVKKNPDPFSNFLMTLLKIWCFIVVIIPGICLQVGFVVAIGLIIYLIVKGISLYGILILVIGLAGIVNFIMDVVWKLVFSRKKICVYPMLISILFVVFGSILSIEYIANITFVNETPIQYEQTTNTYEIILNDETDINHLYQLEIDESLNDNVLKLEITYNSDIFYEVKPILTEDDVEDEIYLNYDLKNTNFKLNNTYLKMIVDDLKEDKIYNYGKLTTVKIKVYANSNTSKFLD